MVDTVYATIEPAPNHPLPNAYSRLLLRGLIEHFRLPSPIGVPAYGGPIHQLPIDLGTVFSLEAVPESVSVAISGEAMFTLGRDGRLRDARLIASSLSASLDDQLIHTVAEFDSTLEMPPFPPGVDGDSVIVFFGVGGRDSTRVSAPLFAAAVPVWVLDQMTRVKGTASAPRYPAREERERIPGSVLISLVVDAHGTPRMDTMRIFRETDSAFGRAVLNVLPTWRFEPARIGGCPVAQRVQIPFAFKIP